MFGRVFGKAAKPGQEQRKKDEGEDEEALLPAPSASSPQARKARNDQKNREIRIAVRTTLLCTAVYLGVGIWLGLILKGTQFVADADDFCLKHTVHESPVVKAVKPHWHTVQYNGTFFHANIYRQSASPEVDAAWAALGVGYRSIVVPESEAEKAGMRPDQVKRSREYGGGFPANVEGLHHLHCLDLLRKGLYWNYEYYREQKEGAFVNSEYVARYHMTHCLDILRQQLMCTPDVGVMGQVWYQFKGEAHPIPFVDFNTKHKCRDYEAVRKWAEDNQLPPATEVDMSRFYEKPKPGDTIYPEIP